MAEHQEHRLYKRNFLSTAILWDTHRESQTRIPKPQLSDMAAT